MLRSITNEQKGFGRKPEAWPSPIDWPNRWKLGQKVMQDESTEVTQMRRRDGLLTPGEVAAMFRVDPKTVTRWAKAGKLKAIRTLGGHRRFRESEVRSHLDGQRIHTGI